MSFRTIVIKERSKLDLKLNYLVCRNDKEIKVFIPEISVLILESTAISLTSALISELIKNNVKIIFCDEKHNPESEVCAYYGCYNNSKKILTQIQWDSLIKQQLWTLIIKEKIKKQSNFLKELDLIKESEMLQQYRDEVEINDITNREGHSAKVYFNAVFGMNFNRRDTDFINSALNYGYAILLSCFNREVVRNGYLTQLGIWHRNEFNMYNLSSDLMEPFRVLVDKIAIDLHKEENYKIAMLEMFNLQLEIDGKKQYLENAISIYCKSIFSALEKNNLDLVEFYE